MKLIFISLDTLRANRLGCYGYKLPTTSPYMDHIASQDVLFLKTLSILIFQLKLLILVFLQGK
ncbi:hypothetical protein A6K24_18975 [Metabacillus litoralis]|uniref:Sulfatase N-terminal domain-containing protein n=1 Tax=Metabacillus litoralis TaxID=152268 RepID=A0A179T3Y2_9BACI|nr:hypothetical protein A6K24_18975 [Metabacillus litoralis]